jgi:hypothetical protein
VCDVYDQGRGLDDPLVGFKPPGGHPGPRRHGTPARRQLSDALVIRSGPDGTAVRLTIAR